MEKPITHSSDDHDGKVSIETRKVFMFTNISHPRIMDEYEIKAYLTQMFAFMKRNLGHGVAIDLKAVDVNSQSVLLHAGNKSTLQVVTHIKGVYTPPRIPDIDKKVTESVNVHGGGLMGRLWWASNEKGYFGTLDSISVKSYPGGELEAYTSDTRDTSEPDPFKDTVFNFNDTKFFEKNFSEEITIEGKQADQQNQDDPQPFETNSQDEITFESKQAEISPADEQYQHTSVQKSNDGNTNPIVTCALSGVLVLAFVITSVVVKRKKTKSNQIDRKTCALRGDLSENYDFL